MNYFWVIHQCNGINEEFKFFLSGTVENLQTCIISEYLRNDAHLFVYITEGQGVTNSYISTEG